MELSIVILTRNEEETIEGCLKSAEGLGEILIVDDCSTDETLQIARKHTDKIFVREKKNFSDQRNFGLKNARGNWIFYLDADERITRGLRDEIKERIEGEKEKVCFLVKRRNFYLGREMFSDQVHRLFRREKLVGWSGEVHESPRIQGPTGELNQALVHFTHRSIVAMLEKTTDWSGIEAKLRLEADHPQVSWWRILHVMIGELYKQFFQKKIWRFKTEGFIEGVFQIFSIFITYARLWEQQRKKSLKESYQELEREV